MTSNARLLTYALVTFALHVAVMLIMQPAAVILAATPVLQLDYSTHYEQCKRAVETFNAHGRMWLWDPHLLAGQLSGAIFDADNKGYELWCLALTKLGVSFDRAYSLFPWFVSALVHPIVMVSARLFGVTLRGSIAAAALASLMWWFDGFMHWMWFVGMISWGFAAVVFLLPLSLFVAYLRDRKRWLLIALAPALALNLTIHPYAFFVLAAPMLVLYVRARDLSRNEHVAIVAVALFAVASNLWWLRPALRFWHYILDSGYYLDASPDFALWDWLALTKDPWVTGVIANRTGFRFLALALAVIALIQLRRVRDERIVFIGVAVFVPFFIAYVGGVTPILRQVQPYRFVAPAMMLCAVLGGAALDALVEPLRDFFRARVHVAATAALAVTACIAVPRLVRDVLYFAPSVLPDRGKPLPLPPPNVTGAPGLGALGWQSTMDFRIVAAAPHELATIEIVKVLDDGSGRFLVEWWSTGEQLAGRTDAQILGGFREINLAHSDANWFRVQPEDAAFDVEKFRAYLEAFNVKWVSLMKVPPALESHELLEPVNGVPGRWFRVKKPSGWFIPSGPGLVRATNDRIDVRGSAGGSLVLRYHYLETLVCRPGCTVRRVASPATRVGFIGVDNAPRDFEIVNAP
jgi:hypothetical protein